MPPPLLIASGVLLALIWAVCDLVMLRLALRAAPGGTVRITLPSRLSLEYEAADAHAEPAPARRCRPADDEDAFDSFFRSTYDKVHRILAWEFRAAAVDIEGALQHAYTAVYRQCPTPLPEAHEKQRRLVLTAARNKARDEIRAQERAAKAYQSYAGDPTSPLTPADEPAEAAAQRRVLHDALRATLTAYLAETAGATERRIVRLHFTTEGSTAEIAESAGCSRRTVNRVVNKAHAALEARFEADYPHLTAVFRAEQRTRRRTGRRHGSANAEEAGQ